MGFLFGVFAAFGVMYFVRHRHPRNAGDRHRSGRGRRFSPGAAMRRRWMRRWHSRGVERVGDWIDASPSQARALADEAFGLLDEAHRAHRGASLRGVFAEALRVDTFDKDAVEGALDARAEAMRGLKDRAVAAVERMRGELDDEQRQELAALVEHGPHGRCHRRPVARD